MVLCVRRTTEFLPTLVAHQALCLLTRVLGRFCRRCVGFRGVICVDLVQRLLLVLFEPVYRSLDYGGLLVVNVYHVLLCIHTITSSLHSKICSILVEAHFDEHVQIRSGHGDGC